MSQKKSDPEPGTGVEQTKILVAEDDPVSRKLIQKTLEKWGYEVIVAEDGDKAWEILTGDDAPRMAVLDWMMPGRDGPAICRKARAEARTVSTYLILLTARHTHEDLIYGLESGADDYVSKPFDRAELRARVGVGARILELQARLSERVRQLEQALAQVKQLRGLLPICMYCKKIRNDGNYWQKVESYISAHSEAEFSHGICPDCYERFVKGQLG